MNYFTSIISDLKEYKTLSNAVKNGRLSAATGLTSVHKANVILALCQQLEKH